MEINVKQLNFSYNLRKGYIESEKNYTLKDAYCYCSDL